MGKKNKKNIRNADSRPSLMEALGLSRITQIFQNERLLFFVGMLLFAVSCCMVVSFISFFTTGQVDVSMIENLREGREPSICSLSKLDFKIAAVIGLFQLIAAVFPGTSRSGATIVGALMLGVSRAVAVIRRLLNYIRRHDFKPFGWYRIALGVVVLAFFALRAAL